MTAFEIVALTGALAGISMVLGGIWLVWQGALTLAATPKSDALTIEWKKQFRINTQVPGLAFFLIGLLFMALSLSFLKPPPVVPIEFDGEIQGLDEPPLIVVRPENWELAASTGGHINGRVYPDLSVMLVMVNAPGYEPYTQSINVANEGHRVVHVGTLQLRRQVNESDLQKQIVTLPFTAPPPKAAGTGFGVAQ